MAPLGRVSTLSWLTSSAAMRMGSVDTSSANMERFFDQGAAASKKIREHIQSMHTGEYHHVCLSGDNAGKFVDTFILKDSGSVREPLNLKSTLNPERECKAETAQVGNVVYSITDQLEDACVPRWKLHTTTCDVLVHANSGPDCSQLFKFRLTHENCDADLIVVYDDQEMPKCYTGQMAKFAQDHPGASCGEDEETSEWIFAAADGSNDQVASEKMVTALAKNGEKIKRMIEQAEGLDKGASVIALLQEAKKQETKMINVAEELAEIQHTHGGDVKSALMQLSTRMKRGLDDEDVAIVVDLGSGTLRAGFAGEDEPKVSFPNMVGVPKYKEVIVGVENKAQYVGDEADAIRGVLVLTYPIKHGIVENWEMLDLIWEHTFTEKLGVSPNGKKIMITEPPLNPFHVRDQLAKSLFDTHSVAGMYINNAAVLSIYAAGRSTGLAVSSGDGVTHVVPVYEGYGLTDHIKRLDLGGSQINTWLQKLLTERGQFRGNEAGTSAAIEIFRKMKETQCYVAFNEAQKDNHDYKDFDEALKKPQEEVDYELPDGQIIQLGHERFRCAEPMFDPLNTIGLEGSSIQELIVESIEACAIDVRDALYSNICVSGGNSMFPGFADRLKKEVEKLRPAKKAVTIVADADRHMHTWIGGAILSSLESFNNEKHPMWFTKAEYGEKGIEHLRKKCPWAR